MLLGTYTHSLDAKNRMIIPSKLMDELDGKLYIYPAASGACIKLYDEAAVFICDFKARKVH